MKMTRRESIVAGTLGALGWLGSAQPGALFAADEEPARRNKSAKVTLLQSNDCHGYLDLHQEWFAGPQQPVYRAAGGYARIATLVKQIREETQGRVLFCDNGDTFHGTYPVVKSRGEVCLPILNQMGLQAMTVHWDFAYGPQRMQELAAGLKYPVLATNIYHTQTGQRFFPPYAVREVGEVSPALNRDTTLEATMDNFLLAAMQEAAGTPLAFCNGWRWGTPVRPGPVTQNDLYNILPMPVPISTVDLTGRELNAMLEENLERTFSADPFHQMGGYVKRCLGLTLYLKIENPPGTRIQKLFVGGDEVQPDKIYRAAYLSAQAVAANYGRNRQDLPQPTHEAMLAYLAKHKPAGAELRGSVVAN